MGEGHEFECFWPMKQRMSSTSSYVHAQLVFAATHLTRLASAWSVACTLINIAQNPLQLTTPTLISILSSRQGVPPFIAVVHAARTRCILRRQLIGERRDHRWQFIVIVGATLEGPSIEECTLSIANSGLGGAQFEGCCGDYSRDLGDSSDLRCDCELASAEMTARLGPGYDHVFVLFGHGGADHEGGVGASEGRGEVENRCRCPHVGCFLDVAVSEKTPLGLGLGVVSNIADVSLSGMI